MGIRPDAKYRQIISKLMILSVISASLFVLNPAIVGIGSGGTGDESEYEWNVTVSQSNESWPILLEYSELPVFYQNLFLECEFSPETPNVVNLTAKNSSITLSTASGVFNVLDPRDFREYSWERWKDVEEIEKETIYNRSVFLKPEERDSNFKLIVTLQVMNETGHWVYSENHSFWIIGEPKVFIHDSLYEDVDIIMTYAVSILIGGSLVLFFLWDRRVIGGDP